MYGTYDVSKGTVTITVDEKGDHHITQTTTDEAGNTIYATNKDGDTVKDLIDNDITLTGTTGSNAVTIDSGKEGNTAKVTLDNVSLSVSGYQTTDSPLTVRGKGKTELELNGSNRLNGNGTSAAGLRKEGTGNLTIKGDAADDALLTYNPDHTSNFGEGNAVVARLFHDGVLYKTVHNLTYVKDTTGCSLLHDWVKAPDGEYKAPTLDEEGYIDCICQIDGCGEKARLVLPKLTPDEPDAPAPVAPVTPVTPDAPAQDETPGTVPAEDITVIPADTADAAQGETAAVTPIGAQGTVQAAADALPQTGVNWFTAFASALSGFALMAAGLVLNRKKCKH